LSPRHVAVIGGGYSGTLQTIHLLRRGAEVTLIERAERLGRGIAYSTPYADHLLNVPAGRMSAFPDQPGHFAGWLAKRGEGGPEDFAQRRVYGAYLEELLDVASQEAGDRLNIVSGEAIDVATSEGGEIVHLRDGTRIVADAAILALGNLEPDIPRGIAPELRTGGIYVADPWASDIAADLGDTDTVFLIGTGLTAIDAALMLDSAGFRGRTLAVSRRGLVPRSHAPGAHAHRLERIPEVRGSGLIRFVRKEAEWLGWRVAIDQLRPLTQSLWARSGPEERRRFLRHLRPWWDVHRHRIAPSIAERIEGMERSGRLAVASGKIVSISPGKGRAAVEWRPRGSDDVQRVQAARVVNCTGPQMDIARAGEPLLDRLIETGRIRPDVCRIGIDVDEDWRTLDRAGEASSTLFAVGPMTRGAVWEIVAVPDIRNQVQALANRLAA
jgi:uncharacterized NAD(P)/FAD-binding protein YdhS